jgi:hypothetical protein
MPNRRLSHYDRLPDLDRELIDVWNDIVFKRVMGPNEIIRLPDGSTKRLADLLARCSNAKGWCVYASTASTVTGSVAHQAIGDGKYPLAIEVLKRLQTHPRIALQTKLEQDRLASLQALAYLMNDEIDEAVKLWAKVMEPVNARPLAIFYDLSHGCFFYKENRPNEEVDPRLLPVLRTLKSKVKKIQAVADGSKVVTYRELWDLLEAQRIRMSERRKAKLGKPVKHAS